MTLLELSFQYADSAERLRLRIKELRAEIRAQDDPGAVRQLRLRIDALTPLLRETREIAALTAHYYDHSRHATL